MLNPESRALTNDNEPKNSNKVSVVLLTQNPLKPMLQHPSQVMSSIPREISKEVIVVHYNSRKRVGVFDQAIESTNSNDDAHSKEKLLHIRVEGEFSSAVMSGIESSTGKYIVIMDADLPYSKNIVPELISSLIANPDSIIVASRYIKNSHIRRKPFIQKLVGKSARLIAKYGLKIKNVKDPLSGCFALSRHVIQDIRFEGRGKEALLEILVKARNKTKNKVPVKEIPIKQNDVLITRRLEFKRIMNYVKDVWQLYRYGKKSSLDSERENSGQRQRSVLFLSKAGRFFTVGASGLAVNIAGSFLFSSLVPNAWYMSATVFGIMLSLTSNFILNKLWTFEDKNFAPRHFVRQYVLFLSLCSLGIGIQLSLVFVFMEEYHIPYIVSLILAVFVASFSNFLLNKKITFGEKIWE
jgi:dolichol-phosphate mannosyltransferase